MTKDILVDSCVAKNFCNPLSDEYKNFIAWIRDEGTLVVTNRLIADYNRTTGQSASLSNICYLVSELQRHGRLIPFTNKQLASIHFPKRVLRRLRANGQDWDQIKAVVHSPRKFAVSLDDNFRHDINNFQGVTARAEPNPDAIPYR